MAKLRAASFPASLHLAANSLRSSWREQETSLVEEEDLKPGKDEEEAGEGRVVSISVCLCLSLSTFKKTLKP